jgi:flagellar protein FlaG
MADSISNINSLAPGTLMTALAAAQAQAPASTQAPATTTTAAAATAPASSTATTSATPGSSSPAGSSTSTSSSSSATTSKPANPLQEETAKVLGTAVKTLQDYIKPQQTATIQVDHATGQSYVKIVNAQTQQLVLQIPSAQVLAMAQKLQQMDNTQSASGVLVDQEG